jgi:flagellar M-ring protein FliF
VAGWWKKISLPARIFLVAVACAGALAAAGLSSWRAAHRPVPLYPLTRAEDVAQIAPRLVALGAPFSIEGGKTILVDPADRARLVGALLEYGFPRWHPAGDPGAGGMLESDAVRRERAFSALRADLTAEIEQFSCVGSARVNLFPGDSDSVPAVKPRASILIGLRPGMEPGPSQVEAVVSLVASAVPGLDPGEVKVVDTDGRVWNDGLRPLLGGDGASDEHLGIKRAYEATYRAKLCEALDRVVGRDNYACAVNADLDFSQVKVVQTRVGGAERGERVVLERDDQVETLGKGGEKNHGPYQKRHLREKADVDRTERTAVIGPGAVGRLSATIVVDGRRSAAELDTLRTLAQGALGHDAEVSVRAIPLARSLPVADAPAPVAAPPEETTRPLLFLALIPSLFALAAGAVWLARIRTARTRQATLELRLEGEAEGNGIADLLNDKIGRRESIRTTAVARTATLEAMAREKPTRIADLIKSTWLSECDR